MYAIDQRIGYDHFYHIFTGLQDLRYIPDIWFTDPDPQLFSVYFQFCRVADLTQRNPIFSPLFHQYLCLIINFSGKTGFTADAGYCYVGALQRDERTFIVALLACGWPNNKGYKWSDTRKLMEYGLDNYEYRQIDISMDTGSVLVENGAAGRFPGTEAAELKVEVNAEPFRVLLRRDEDVNVFCDLPEKIELSR